MDELTMKRRTMLGAMLVETMLVVSTAHMTEDEATAIESGDHWCQPVLNREEGFMFVMGYLTESVSSGDFLTLSEGFRGCIRRASDLGCDWLMFDRDADPIEDIKVYDW